MPILLRRALLLVAAAAWSACALAATPEIVLVPKQVSAHGWFFEGESGMASAANKGFMSNAGFVVTNDGVVVFDALGTPARDRDRVRGCRRRWDARWSPRSAR